MTSISNLTRLNSFTLSCCGSRTPLPTLKPNLTVSVPRLCTGCSLGFTRVGLSPTRITGAELAHHPKFFPALEYALPFQRKHFLTQGIHLKCADRRSPTLRGPRECADSLSFNALAENVMTAHAVIATLSPLLSAMTSFF